MNKFKRIAALVLAFAIFLTCSAFAVDGKVFDASALKVRALTSTDSDVLGKLANGSKLDIQGKIGDWYMINYNGKTGFVFGEYVDLGEYEVKNTMGVITGSTVNVRTGPGTENKVAGKLVDGTMVSVLAVESGWYKIKFLDLEGYVCADYLDLDGVVYTYVKTDEKGVTTTNYTTGETDAKVPDVNLPLAQQIIEYAKNYLDVPYVYGGTTPDGFDCSGFVQYVFKAFDIKLKRSSADQYKCNGKDVAKADLQPGDLVFFSRSGAAVGHVGIYIGDDCFIHATSTGDVIRITSLSSKYYVEHYVGAKRVL